MSVWGAAAYCSTQPSELRNPTPPRLADINVSILVDAEIVRTQQHISFSPSVPPQRVRSWPSRVKIATLPRPGPPDTSGNGCNSAMYTMSSRTHSPLGLASIHCSRNVPLGRISADGRSRHRKRGRESDCRSTHCEQGRTHRTVTCRPQERVNRPSALKRWTLELPWPSATKISPLRAIARFVGMLNGRARTTGRCR